MDYGFDSVTDRRNTGSLKWDVKENELPMWVADMDFKTAPCIIEAVKKCADHGVFGYSVIPDEWAQSYIGWWKTRHGLDISPEELIFCTGVVPAISSCVRKLTTPAEKVLIQTPVYNIFFNSIVNNGRYVIESPLVYENGVYSVDFEDLEKKLSDPQTSLMILCNPHNPVGKIWDAATLAEIGKLCKKHGVTVISDEIHCDITEPNKGYVPFASVSDVCREISVSCIAPTKCFGIPGINSAAVMIPDPKLRHKVWRALNTDEVAEPNSFAVAATVAAFTKGGDWLDSLREYLFENRRRAEKFIEENIPGISAVKADATYLIWLDCRSLSCGSEELGEFIRSETGLYLTPGAEYGAPGEGFLRLNAACPKSVLDDGLNRLKRGIEAFMKSK